MDSERVRPTTTWVTWPPYLTNRSTEAYSLGCSVHIWYWRSMLRSFDCCQNKIAAYQYHMIISWAQVYSLSRSCVTSQHSRLSPNRLWTSQPRSSALGLATSIYYRKQWETEKLIFSWLSWLAVLLVVACTRRRWRSRAPSRPYFSSSLWMLGFHVMVYWHLSRDVPRIIIHVHSYCPTHWIFSSFLISYGVS